MAVISLMTAVPGSQVVSLITTSNICDGFDVHIHGGPDDFDVCAVSP